MEYKHMMFGTGVSSSKSYETAFKVIDMAFANGLYYFDTAPSYGTEELLGTIISQCRNKYNIGRDKVFIQTKIDAWQMQDKNGKNVRAYVENAIRNIKLDYLDSVLIHWPVPEYLEATWDELVKIKNQGYVCNIGVCNVRMRQLVKIVNWNMKPDIIQIERNPLRTCLEETDFCKNNGFELQAYSPLCKMDSRISNSDIIKNLANKYGKSIGQVVLRWHIDTGCIPIFTTTKDARVKEYTDIMDFHLLPDDILQINSLNEDYKMYLEACACPGF